MAGFDPDAYLSGGNSGANNNVAFDPDAYLQAAPSQGAPEQRTGGFWRNVLAGAEDIPHNLMNTAYQAASNFPLFQASALGSTLASKAVNKNAANPMQAIQNGQAAVDSFGNKVTNAVGSVTGVSPDNTSQSTFTDKFGRVLGGTAPLAVAPGAGLLGNVRNLTVGAGLALSQAGVEQQFPNNPTAQTIGGLLGAVATHGALKAGSSVARSFSSVPAAEQATQYVSQIADSANKSPLDIAGFNVGDKPFIGAEAIGTPAITATRALGIRPGTTGNNLRPMLEERAEGQGPRILGDFADATGIDPESAKGNIDALVKSGRIVAKPMYDKAFAGDGTGAFEQPLTQAFDQHSANVKTAQTAVNDAENQMTLAETQLHNAGDNVYGNASALEAKRMAQRQLDQANAQLDQATTQRDATKARLNQAQDDNANGVQGGVWSPRLQQFLDHPDVKAGINAGLTIQKREDLADNVPHNPKDYAVTGTDADGNAIVSGVPNMRLLDAGKRGMDAQLKLRAQANNGVLPKDEDTQSLLNLKNAYVDELDNLSTNYKAARSAASDYLSAQDAFNRSQSMFFNPRITSKQYQTFLDGLSDSDTNVKAAKGGVANGLFNMAQNGNLRGSGFSKPILMKKLQGVVDDPAKSADFLMNMDQESQMAKSGARMHPGLNSTTAESSEATSAQDIASAGISAGKALYYGSKGNLVSGGANALDAWSKIRAFGKTAGMPVDVRNEAGRLMMLPPADLASHLQSYRDAHALAQSKLPRLRAMTLLPAFTNAQQGDQQ